MLDGLVTTGYDACTTASNHSVDPGFRGLVRTVDALDARGLAHTGTYAQPAVPAGRWGCESTGSGSA